MTSSSRTSGTKTACLLAGLAVLTRLPFTSKILFSMDSVQFALGMDRFDVSLHQPHPPGYFLYVMAGRLARLIFHDANTALVGVSIVAGALTVALVYLLGREVFDEAAGLAAGVFALTSPLIWFHGEVALSYMPEALMSVSLAYVCFRVIRGEAGLYWLAAVILGVSGGIRQNTMVFLMPLWLYSMRGVGARRVAAGLAIFGASVAAWFVPMLIASGGYGAYSAALGTQWRESVWGGLGLARTIQNAGYVAYFVFYGLGVASAPIAALVYFRLKGRARLEPDRSTSLFFLVWMAPAALFHILVFFQPGAPGYVLIYLVGALVLSGRALTAASEAVAGARPGRFAVGVRRGALLFIVAANVVFFLFRTDALSAGGIREHDHYMDGYFKAVRAGFSPADTEIVGSERFVCNYRHAMYYLPEYRAHDGIYVPVQGGTRVFWGRDMKTATEPSIEPMPGTRHFIYLINYRGGELANLPPGAKYVNVYGDYYLVSFDDLGTLLRTAGISQAAEATRRAMAARER